MTFLLTMNLPYTPSYGGANRSNRLLLEALSRNGHRVCAVVPTGRSPASNSAVPSDCRIVAEQADSIHLISRGVEVYAARSPQLLRHLLVRTIERINPDRVVVSTEDPSQNLLQAAWKVCPDRVVYLVHTMSMLPFGPWSFFPSRERTRRLQSIRRVVTISQYVKGYLKTYGGLDSVVARWPSFGTPPPRFNGPRRHITMVNPCRVKGLPLMIKLAKQLPEHPFLAVKSWGTTSADLRDMERIPNIRVVEPRANVYTYLKTTRVVIVPSLWGEGFPLTIVEALAAGIPVLASDSGGNAEALLGTMRPIKANLIRHFDDRLDDRMIPTATVPPQNSVPWVRQLRLLFSDERKYQMLARLCKLRARQFVAALDTTAFEDAVL